jgi:hypothetical protein
MSVAVALTVELFYSGTWHDITSYVYERDRIQITRGRPNETTSADPSSCSLTLNNRDGRFSSRNPNSPLYGLIGRNTPLRVKAAGNIRFVGEVPGWPQSWDTTGTDVYVQLQAAGILRRLGQGQEAATGGSTALKMFLLGYSALRYWPLDDGVGAHSGAPAANSESLSSTIRVGTNAIAKFGTGDLGALPPGLTTVVTAAAPSLGIYGYTTSGDTASNTCDFVFKSTSLGPLTFTFRDGALDEQSWIVKLRADGINDDVQVQLNLYDSSTGVNTTTTEGTSAADLPALTDDELHLVRFTTAESGANVIWGVSIDGVTVVNGTHTSLALHGVNIVFFNYAPGATNTAVALGHLAVYVNGAEPLLATLAQFVNGHIGETAGRRIERLCSENGITFTSSGDLDATEAMGAQGTGGLVALLQECAAADLGVLYEPRDALGLAYRTREDFYNQAAALTLDYSAFVFGAPPNPTDDDQNVHNDVTVSGAGGTAEAVLAAGPLSILPPPDGINAYPGSASVNVESTGQLTDIASWLLHLGTVNEDRYPSLTLDLLSPAIAGNGTLTSQIVALDVTDRLVIENLPAWMPPDDTSQLALGYSEDLWQFGWTITLNCAPASPYGVAVYGSSALRDGARFDAENSTLATTATTGATSLSVASAANTELWTTAAEEPPFDIIIAGERMTLTSIGQVLNDNPFFLTNAAGWSGAGATVARSTAVVNSSHDAVASLLITPDGVSASGGANEVPRSAVGTVTPAAQYRASLWAYSPGGWSDLRAAVDWFDSSDVFLSSSLGSGTSVPAATWTMLQQTFTAPASASRASVRARHGGTPAAGNIWYAWAILLVPMTSFSTSPQTFTVTRSVNGVVKSHVAGEAVRLWNTPKFAL